MPNRLQALLYLQAQLVPDGREGLVHLVEEVVPHRLQGQDHLLTELLPDGVQRLVHLLLELLPHGLEHLVHLLQHGVRDPALHLLQDGVDGLRDLLLEQLPQVHIGTSTLLGLILLWPLPLALTRTPAMPLALRGGFGLVRLRRGAIVAPLVVLCVPVLAIGLAAGVACRVVALLRGCPPTRGPAVALRLFSLGRTRARPSPRLV